MQGLYFLVALVAFICGIVGALQNNVRVTAGGVIALAVVAMLAGFPAGLPD